MKNLNLILKITALNENKIHGLFLTKSFLIFTKDFEREHEHEREREHEHEHEHEL